MPDGVSTMRGGGLPGEGSSDSPLTTTAPSPAMSPCGDHLEAVAAGAGREHDRVRQLERAEADGEIRRHGASHDSSPASKTGPCWQASRYPPPAGTVQPRQRPRPQAISGSTETFAATPCPAPIRATAASIPCGPQAEERDAGAPPRARARQSAREQLGHQPAAPAAPVVGRDLDRHPRRARSGPRSTCPAARPPRKARHGTPARRSSRAR